MAACEAWRTRGGPEAVALLAARSEADQEIDVRLKALRELGDLGDEGAVPALARALEDPDPAVQFRAVGALKQVSGRDLGDDVNAWRAWAADPNAEGTEWTIAEGFRRVF
jgi:HEAT repeat protein